jgi:hypothetical protein
MGEFLMITAPVALAPTRKRLTAVLLAAAAAVVLLFAFQASTAQAATCEGGKVCVWEGTNYNPQEYNVSCGVNTGFFNGLELKSAKNHCSVNARIGWEEGGVINWKACLSPGGERPELGRFNRVYFNVC